MIEGEAFIVATHDDDKPRIYYEALSSPTLEEWVKVMNDEKASMRTNLVWELVDLPPEDQAIGNEWVMRIKHKTNGSIERYKACLMANGYT